MCSQACDGQQQAGENRGSQPGAQPPSGEVIDTLPLKGNLIASPDGSRDGWNPSGPEQDFRGNHPITVATF